MNTSLQDRLREARKEAGLTQAQVADRVGIKQPTYSDLEKVQGTGSTKLPQIAEVLHVRALWLATGGGPKQESDFFLNDDESEIVRAWRLLPPQSQEMLMTQIRALAAAQQPT